MATKDIQQEFVHFDAIKGGLSEENIQSFNIGISIGEKIRDEIASLPVDENIIIYAMRYLGACAIAMDLPPYPTDEQRAEREAVFTLEATLMGREIHDALIRTFERECPDGAKQAKEEAAKKCEENAE